MSGDLLIPQIIGESRVEDDVSRSSSLAIDEPPPVAGCRLNTAPAIEKLRCHSLYIVVRQTAMRKAAKRQETAYAGFPVVAFLAPEPCLVFEPQIEKTVHAGLDHAETVSVKHVGLHRLIAELVHIKPHHEGIALRQAVQTLNHMELTHQRR